MNKSLRGKDLWCKGRGHDPGWGWGRRVCFNGHTGSFLDFKMMHVIQTLGLLKLQTLTISIVLLCLRAATNGYLVFIFDKHKVKMYRAEEGGLLD